jgi:hypothetical protein
MCHVQVKSSDERLSDRVAIGVLTRAFPPSLVDEVLARTGRVEQLAGCCLPEWWWFWAEVGRPDSAPAG